MPEALPCRMFTRSPTCVLITKLLLALRTTAWYVNFSGACAMVFPGSMAVIMSVNILQKWIFFIFIVFNESIFSRIQNKKHPVCILSCKNSSSTDWPVGPNWSELTRNHTPTESPRQLLPRRPDGLRKKAPTPASLPSPSDLTACLAKGTIKQTAPTSSNMQPHRHSVWPPSTTGNNTHCRIPLHNVKVTP